MENKNEWKKVKLGDIGEIVSGGTPKTSVKEYWNGNISWLTPKDFSNKNYKYWNKGERNITKEGLKNSSAKLLPKGTVLFTSRAPIGYIGISDTNLCTNQGFKNIIVNEENSNEFIYYLLKFITPQIINIAGGSTFKEISATALRDFEVYIPKSKKYQEKIAKILSDIDAKIELNNKINNNLEEQAQLIFKNYFITFNHFLGLKPSHWRNLTLEKIATLIAGGDKPKNFSNLKTKKFNIPIFSNGIINDGLYGYTDIPKILNESVTVSARGTIGFICLREEPYVPIVRLISIIPQKNIISAKYIYLWLKTINIQGTGSTQQQLTIPEFKKTKILVPDEKIMKEFTNLINPLFEKIKNNQIENEKLTNLKNCLLPKLMNGEIDVEKIEL